MIGFGFGFGFYVELFHYQSNEKCPNSETYEFVNSNGFPFGKMAKQTFKL